MKDYSNIKNPRFFYSALDGMGTFYLFFLIVITLGFYIIEWLYNNNKVFEVFDSDAPDKERAFFVVFLIPTVWFLLNYFVSKVGIKSFIIEISKIAGWFFVLVLITKYIYDFTASFGRITETSGLFWFLVMLIPFLLGLGIMQLCLKTHLNFLLAYLIFLAVGPVGIVAMQAEINLFINKIHMKRERNLFYLE